MGAQKFVIHKFGYKPEQEIFFYAAKVGLGEPTLTHVTW